ncbi:hypothetical protein E2I00_017913, partial [Balaenoptera physalus]
PVVAQGNGAAARNREADTVELAELGPPLEEQGQRGVTSPSKAEEGQACPGLQEEEEEGRARTLPLQAHHGTEKKEEVGKDYLLHGRRPPMPFFRACFKSIFRMHTETGNFWTHLLGFVPFHLLGILTMLRPNMYFMARLQEKVVFAMFFLGAPRLIYLPIICVLGISAIIVAQWDRFASPKHQQTRAGVFLGLGLSGAVPTMHFTIAEGFVKATTADRMGWFFLMAVTYITGAGLYATRVPERFFPGKFDIQFQPHQIFHVLEVAAAFIHFYGVSNLQEFRYCLERGCTDSPFL